MSAIGRRLKRKISLNVNGQAYVLEVEPRSTLAEVLREELRLTGTKVGCNRAECGVCTVLMDKTPVYSCTVLGVEADGKRVETVESLSGAQGLHPLQHAFVKYDALQCGFCTPGMLLCLKSLLESEPSASEDDIKMAIAGVYCRCGAYPNIVKAALDALSRQRRDRGDGDR